MRRRAGGGSGNEMSEGVDEETDEQMCQNVLSVYKRTWRGSWLGCVWVSGCVVNACVAYTTLMCVCIGCCWYVYVKKCSISCVCGCTHTNLYLAVCSGVCTHNVHGGQSFCGCAIRVCVSEFPLHAGPSAQGDNKHISLQTEAKQPLSKSHRHPENY